MLYGEIITVECENHMKHTNILRVNSMKIIDAEGGNK
jgi:hypothetical protein